MKKIALTLIIVFLLSSISFAETISIDKDLLRLNLENLKMAKKDYVERRNTAIATTVLGPLFALLNFNWATEYREAGKQELADVAVFYGALFIIGSIYAYFVDLPETNKKIDSVNRSILEIEMVLF